MIGGALSTPLDFHLPSALKWASLCFPAGLAGAVYGCLQGLVGLRDPQPEGSGMITMFLTIGAAGIGYFALGTLGAILMGLPMCLLGGRYFGFHPGKNRHS